MIYKTIPDISYFHKFKAKREETTDRGRNNEINV